MIERISWALLALIHLPPALALFRPALLTRLYGIGPDSPAFLLLQHRAALFVVVVVLCVGALFDPAVRRTASVGVAVSMLTFLLLYWQGGSPPALRTIAIADLVGLPVLAVAAFFALRH